MKYITLFSLLVDNIIIIGSSYLSKSYIFLFGLGINIFWLHYKIYYLIFNTYKLFINLNELKTNKKYYSGIEILDELIEVEYPNITIQMPIYMEDFNNTIKPTLLNVINESEMYYNETNSICNIIVCDDGLNLLVDEAKEERILFYKNNNISFTARPHPNKLKRNGRFKKAGNLNFSMNKKEEFVLLGAIYEGNLKYGDYILLIDSDTRLPKNCLKKLVKEYLYDTSNNILYLQCFTAPYLSTKSLSEKCIYHFTSQIYNNILISTLLNSISPLVGHNVMINHKLLLNIAEKDISNNYIYYWNENKISEDFYCMMNGNYKGYIGKYISYTGPFLEGISFTYLTEYLKISKFACGAFELILNPINKWLIDGIISNDIIKFIKSKEIEWYNKINIISYILNFLAISQSHIINFLNLLFFDKFNLMSIYLLWDSIIIWCIINSILNLLFFYKLKLNIKLMIKQQLREMIFTTSLYSSISVRFSIMCIIHLFNLNFNFGATQKNEEKIKMYDWIKTTKYEFIIYNIYLIAIIIRLIFFPIKSKLYTFYYGCLPLLYNIIWYWLGPLIFDIYPLIKSNNNNYNNEESIFNDKYKSFIIK